MSNKNHYFFICIVYLIGLDRRLAGIMHNLKKIVIYLMFSILEFSEDKKIAFFTYLPFMNCVSENKNISKLFKELFDSHICWLNTSAQFRKACGSLTVLSLKM